MKHGLPVVPTVQRRTCAPWTWFTYPHCNGFTADGSALVLGRFLEGRTVLLRHRLADGREDEIASFPLAAGAPAVPLWYDISLDSDRLAVVAEDRLLVADLTGDGRLREVHRGADGWTLHILPSISADGRRLAVAETRADGSAHGRTRLRVLDLERGWSGELLATGMYASHFHFCPGDEAWIGYCHEGDTTRIPDRMWAWHATRAPQGRQVFDQASAVPGRHLCVGHERWCFHDASALVVAYGVSPHGPRGIWQIPAEGPARLVGGGERDWHVNAARDGRTAILDTTGSLDCAGSGWANGDGLSDVVLLDLASGRRSWLARLDEGARRFAGPRNHPWHPHPHLGPDGRLAVFNDFTPAGAPAAALVWF